MKEIPFSDIENVKVGHAQDYENATGCTVILCEKGAPAGVDIRGGGPASRETPLLCPTAACQGVHAVLLSGGSAFGLDAAGGVMEYLEEKGIGFAVGDSVVPLVCSSCLFDLELVNGSVRPDRAMAYEACRDAGNRRGDSGCIGAGTGATVGKLYGPEFMMKSGLGCYAVQVGALKVGALAAVNALGDVYSSTDGRKLAGLLNREKNGFLDTEEECYRAYEGMDGLFTGNTTIAAVVTNGRFDKTQMNKIAAMAQNGLARTIRPVHTSADGDSVYALSVGDIKADTDVTGTLAARVLAAAIERAALAAKPMYGCLAASDFGGEA